MTITEMRDRLTQIIEQNEREGRTERNNLEVRVSIQQSPRIRVYYPIKWVSSAMLGIPGDIHCIEMVTSPDDAVRCK